MKPDTTKCSGCVVQSASAKVSRRDFVSMATLSAVAVTLAACGGGGGDDVTGPIPPGVGEVTVRVTDFPALATMGGIAKVRNSPPVAMTRTSTGLVASPCHAHTRERRSSSRLMVRSSARGTAPNLRRPVSGPAASERAVSFAFRSPLMRLGRAPPSDSADIGECRTSRRRRDLNDRGGVCIVVHALR